MTTTTTPLEEEGHIPISIPNISLPCSTYYKIIGDLKSEITPLVIVHGGPGLTHDYLIQMEELNERYGIPVVFYDQIGGGRSTHLREMSGDAGREFWVEELFWRELENLVEGLGIQGSWDLFGHSWGGMLGATFAGRKSSPHGLRKLIIANAPASMELWVAGTNRYLKAMDDDLKQLSRKEKRLEIERVLNMRSTAVQTLMGKHSLGELGSTPPELLKTFELADEDETVNDAMSGPSEFVPTGTLKDWSAIEASKKISVPTLVMNGTDERATDESIQPFLDNIEGVEYVKFHQSVHVALYQEKELFLKTVAEWLLEK